MEENCVKNFYYYKDCPFKVLMDHFGNKWSMIIVVALGKNDKMRFNELDKYIEGISQKVLSETLKTLLHDGFINKEIFPVVPPHVEYSLTDLGKSILPILENLEDWSHKHIDDIYKARKKNSKQKKQS